MLFIILCGCNRERNECFHLIAKEHIEYIHHAIPYIYAFTQGFGNGKTNNDTELTGIYYSIKSVEAFFSDWPSRYEGIQNLIITRRDLLINNFNNLKPYSDECVQKPECKQASEAIALKKLWERSHPKYACDISFDGFGAKCPEVCRSRETGYLFPYIIVPGGIYADLKDPWGIYYSIIISDNKRQLIVSSAGPDQSFGTKDDISTTQDVATIINKGQKIKTAITPFFNALEEKEKEAAIKRENTDIQPTSLASISSVEFCKNNIGKAVLEFYCDFVTDDEINSCKIHRTKCADKLFISKTSESKYLFVNCIMMTGCKNWTKQLDEKGGICGMFFSPNSIFSEAERDPYRCYTARK